MKSQADFHSILLHCANKLGYPVILEGACKGFTMRWIEALLSGTTLMIFERCNKIINLYYILQTNESIANLEKDNDWKRDLWDIKAFYESLILYQNSVLASQILNKSICQNNIEEISMIASSDAIQALGCLKQTKPIRYSAVNYDDIHGFLKITQERIRHTNYREHIVFLLTLINSIGNLHAACIVYNPKNETWIYIDVNSYPPRKPQPNLADFILRLPQNYVASSIQAIFLQQPIFLQILDKFNEISLIHNNFFQVNDTILILAAQNGHLEAIIMLVTQRKKINSFLENGATPLFMASQNGHIEVVQELLKAGANPNLSINDGSSPLFMASQAGYLKIVQSLLSQEGIDIDKATLDGATSLYIASQNGHIEVVQELLKAGANPNLSINDGSNPFFIAAQNGHIEILNAFLNSNQFAPNQAKNNNITPLFIAAQEGHLQIVQALLSQEGIEIDKAKIDGATPLFMASQNGHLEIVQALLNAGANPNLSIKDGSSSLFMASQNGHIEVVQELLKAGANPNLGSVEVFTESSNPDLVEKKAQMR